VTERLSPALHSTAVGPADAARRIVFLHGLFGRGKNFTRIASGLAPEARCLLVDLPNHGQSEWTEHVDYRQMADAVAAHLREGFAAEGPVDVVGHSMGGKVAMVLALRHPELVRRLVVVDISPVAAEESRGEFEHLLGALAEVDLGSLRRRTDAGRQLREKIPEDGVRGFLLQNLRRDEAEGFRWEPNLRLLRAELDVVMGFPDAEGARYEGPVLWIAGGRSDYVSREDLPAMRRLFPKVRRMTVHGAGHWVHAEKPEEVIAALRSFLFAG
jgi:pimeloyl-ACP methyl ester carboxylesterase